MRTHPRSDSDPSTAPHLTGRRKEGRTALRIGLGISVLLHLLALLVYSSFGPGAFRIGGVDAPVSEEEDIPALQLIRIAITEEEELERPEEPVRPEEVEEPEEETPVVPPVAPVRAGEPPEGERRIPTEVPTEEGRSLSAAERIRLLVYDPIVFHRIDPADVELTEEERFALEVSVMLEAWNDSVARAAAANAPDTDWTVTDDEGRKWGVSPGQLHLGDVTVPFPFSFGSNPWQADQYRRLQRDLAEIQQQALRGAAHDIRKERVEAIRRWAEEQRRLRRGDTTRSSGGG